MKHIKRNSVKISAIMLALVLLTVNTVVSFATETGDAGVLPATSTGICPSETRILGGEVNNSMAPVISEAGEGINGTYALKAGATKDFYHYRFCWRFNPASRGNLPAKTSTTVEMKVKLVSGKLLKIYAGTFYDAAPNEDNTTYSVADYYTGNDISSIEWTTLTFTRTHTQSVNSQYVFINMTSSGGNGAVILIDDLKVYLTDDPEKKNVLLGPNLMMDSSGTPYTGGNSEVGTFDIIRKESLPFDNTPIEGASYLPVEAIGYSSATVAPVSSAEGEGVKGSYAMQIGVDSKKSNEITFQGVHRTGMDAGIAYDGEEYTVEFKIKLKSGYATAFSVGIQEREGYTTEELSIPGGKLLTTGEHAGKWQYDPYTEYFFTLGTADITDEWRYYRCTIEPNENYANWKRLAFKLDAATEDTVVLIDELQVYRTANADKTLIQYDDKIDPEGLFDMLRNSYTTSAVTDTPTDEKYVPIRFTDWSFEGEDKIATSISNGVPNNFTDGISASQNRVTEHNLIRPRLAEGEGIGGSYALVLGDESVKKVSGYEVGFGYLGGPGALEANKSYTFSVKIKKSGTVDILKIGFLERYNVEYSFMVRNDELSEEWVEYSWEYTTTDECTDAWNRLCIAYSSYDGAEIYIDELNIYYTDDSTKYNRFPYSNFDYVDKGQTEKIVLSNEFPEGEEADLGTVNGNADFAKTGVVARVMSYDDAVSGNGVLAFGFDKEKEAYNNYYRILDATKPGGSYKISFWVLVQGDIEWAYVGMLNSLLRYEYYGEGYSFNQYEQGKWTYVEFVINDPADYLTCKGYRGLHIDFKGPAGTGMLIDDLKVTYIPLGDEAPNIFGNGSFEKPTDVSYDHIVWSDIFVKKGEE